MEIIKGNRFKTWSMNIVFTQKIDANDETMRHILPRVLLNGCHKYTSKRVINRELTKLYDTSIKAYCLKLGTELNAIVFSIVAIKDKYASVSSLAIDLLWEIIYNPLIEGGGFKKEYVNKEKTNLKTMLALKKQDSMRVPYELLIKKLFPQESINVDYLKNETQINKINSKKLYECYLKMFDNQIDIILEEPTEKIISECKNRFNENVIALPLVLKPLYAKPISKIIKRASANYQSNIAVIYGNIDISKYAKIQSAVLFNLMLGGMASSLLFRVIREEHSLAYDISSRFNQNSGLITILAGIEVGKEKETFSLIDKLVVEMQKGDIELLKKAKMNLISSLLSSLDAPGYLGTLAYNQKIYRHNYSTEERIEVINKITMKEIVAIANEIVKYGAAISTVKVS